MSGNDREAVEALKQEYLDLAHAMQSGVTMEMNYNASSTQPEHLRVGTNNALVNCGALAQMLIDKGIVTELEYWTTVRDHMKREVDEYTERIRAYIGAGPHQTITLR